MKFTYDAPWFNIIRAINARCAAEGREDAAEIIQRVKTTALHTLPLRGNMLNLTVKRVPQVEEIVELVFNHVAQNP